jgi:hypothetical protein
MLAVRPAVWPRRVGRVHYLLQKCTRAAQNTSEGRKRLVSRGFRTPGLKQLLKSIIWKGHKVFHCNTTWPYILTPRFPLNRSEIYLPSETAPVRTPEPHPSVSTFECIIARRCRSTSLCFQLIISLDSFVFHILRLFVKACITFHTNRCSL